MAGGRTPPFLAAPTASRAITTSPAIPTRALIPGLVLFRWDAPLFFANAEFFQDRVLQAVAASPTPVRRVVSPPSRSPAST